MSSKNHDTERELVRDFRDTFKKNIKSKSKVVLFDEVKTNWGIVDLLVIYLKREKLIQKRIKNIRANNNIQQFTQLAAHAMLFLSKRKYTALSELSCFLKIKNSKLLNLVDLLSQRNLIRLYKNDKIKIRPIKSIFFINDILAFEAKLKNWKKAITQAERHLWFTNNSYVVIPKVSEKVKSNIIISCQERGIGLILRSSNNGFVTLQRPDELGFINSSLAWKLNEYILDKFYHDKFKSNKKDN